MEQEVASRKRVFVFFHSSYSTERTGEVLREKDVRIKRVRVSQRQGISGRMQDKMLPQALDIRVTNVVVHPKCLFATFTVIAIQDK